MSVEEIESAFPNLAGSGYEVTGDASAEYNCTAWALGITNRQWDYDRPHGYWPPSIPRNQEVGTLMRLFAREGFALCDDDALEPGYEKIALYAFVGWFTHVARQLEDGRWSSKLGKREVITHPSPANLTGGFFGSGHCIMRRP